MTTENIHQWDLTITDKGKAVSLLGFDRIAVLGVHSTIAYVVHEGDDDKEGIVDEPYAYLCRVTSPVDPPSSLAPVDVMVIEAETLETETLAGHYEVAA